jgi:vacuolar-type H+-ATPase subunit H
MAKQDPEAKMGSDEFSRIFDEYRAKIQDITRKTEKSLDTEVNTARQSPEDKLDEIVVARAAAASSHVQIESQPPVPESAKIIAEANRKAKEIIEEAEESVKKEAKKKTRAEVEKILEKARKEAEDTISRARQNIDKEKEDFYGSSKQQAEAIMKELTERCRQETNEQSALVMAEAREKAGKMMADMLAGSAQINRMVTEIIDRARVSFNQFETNVRTDTEELMRAIGETQKVLQQITAPPDEVETKPAETSGSRIPLFFQNKNRENKENKENKEIITIPTLAIRILGEKSNGRNGSQPLFRGQVEMKSISESFDYQYLKNLKKYLVHIPNIKYLQESASEKELSVLFDIQEPLPLLEILNAMPQVEKVVAEEQGISLVFKENK